MSPCALVQLLSLCSRFFLAPHLRDIDGFDARLGNIDDVYRLSLMFVVLYELCLMHLSVFLMFVIWMSNKGQTFLRTFCFAQLNYEFRYMYQNLSSIFFCFLSSFGH
jgi:hypothetical protein